MTHPTPSAMSDLTHAPSRAVALAQIGAFAGVLATLGILFFITPRMEVSDLERRTLASFPVATGSSVASGEYTRSIDLFVADQFPFRETLVEAAFWLRDHRGLPAPAAAPSASREPTVAALTPAKPTGDPTPPPGPDLRVAAGAPASPSSAKGTSGRARPAAAVVDGELKKIDGLMVLDSQAMHPFTGTDKDASHYATTLNGYLPVVDPALKLYALIIPSPAAFYLPKKYRRHSKEEPSYIQRAYGFLDPRFKGVNAYEELARHTDEYLYFRTDHHWTVLGAYYTYRAFARTAGFTPRPLSDFSRTVHDDHYLGTWYGRTRSPDLKKSPDRVDYYPPVTPYTAVKYRKEKPHKAVPATFVRTESPNYGIFLGGDYPLMVATTDVDNGRSVLVVKNSYGNPFAVWLLSHFEKVLVIDYRYFKANILDVIDEHGVTDLVFANGIMTSSTEVHTSLMRRLKKKRRR